MSLALATTSARVFALSLVSPPHGKDLLCELYLRVGVFERSRFDTGVISVVMLPIG